ncbi:MAG: DUF2298 domain-containing protein, partial [Chloroflexota bacterium]
QHLPTMNTPAWLNEFEAEEAFHVYDHPAVFIFRKTDDYDPANTQRILFTESLARTENVTVGLFNDPSLIGVNPLYSLPADQTPTQLQLKPENREIQYANGTWSELFERDSLINRQPVITVVAWWFTIMLIGWVAFPTVFAMFPALADRGYAVSKFAGLMIVAWFAWFATSLNLRLWHQAGLWFTLGMLAALSAVLGWRNRVDLNNFLRTHTGRLLTLEGITLLAFVFFLGVRLSNPDLWHPSFGGEKPMDFAYFNGVLRSTTFPPIDPWHAGGFINYYYFGFVLVGAPVLMLGVVPSVAYNLAIPTVFALTAMGAFSVAFNIVGGMSRDEDVHGWRTALPGQITGSAWTAGIVALLLAVILGNLNTPRVFFEGVARTGGYTPAATINDWLQQQYITQNGAPPQGEDLVEIVERAADPTLADRLVFNVSESWDSFTSIRDGLWRVFQGAPIQIATNRWHWAATRVLAEPPVSSGGAITEMPYFTFLYGDLHAHMISMPMQLFLMLFLFHEVKHAGRRDRRPFSTALAIGLAATVAGMLRATNTWDWPTYMALGTLGLGFAWWLRWKSLSRASMVDMFLRIGGFIALSVWLSLPYTRWYAAIYNSASLWEGVKTPIWAYLVIHGLFIFLIASLLVWETARWLRAVRVRALRGRLLWLYVVLGLLTLLAVITITLTALGWYITIVVLPLLAWAVLLFFRPGQSPEMQFTLVLVAVALFATLFVDYIVVDGDIGRQNTVFKFYLQAWLMFAVAGGVTVAWLLDSSFDWNFPTRATWLGGLGILMSIAALYPIMSTQARAIERMAPDLGLTLDGMAYMSEATHYEVTSIAAGTGEVINLNYDYELIHWMQENIEGTPVIMEGQSESEYRWGSRISIYTGFPSVIGWNFHQRQQRTFSPMPQMVQQRVANVNSFYSTDDVQIAANILQHYNVEYVVISTLEQIRYKDGIDKFYDMVEMGVLEPIYSRDNYALVFRVRPLAAQQLALGMEITDDSNEVARADS